MSGNQCDCCQEWIDAWQRETQKGLCDHCWDELMEVLGGDEETDD